MPNASLARQLIQGLDHVSVTVSDLEVSVRFYRDILGFDLVARQTGDPSYLGPITGYPNVRLEAAFLEMPGGIALELFQFSHPAGRAHDPETFHPLASHICLAVRDVGRLWEELGRAGVAFRSPPIVVSSGVNKGGISCYLRDPDGYTIELYQRPPRP